MPQKVTTPRSLKLSAHVKCQLGNFESMDFGAEIEGIEVDRDAMIARLKEHLFAVGKVFVDGYELPTEGKSAAGQVALSFRSA